jgi:hypothetical protein
MRNGNDKIDIHGFRGWPKDKMGQMKDIQSVVILDPYPERFSAAMHLAAPSKSGRYPSRNFEHIESEWTEAVGDANRGKLFGSSKNGSTVELIQMDQFAKFIRSLSRKFCGRPFICPSFQAVKYLASEIKLLQRLVKRPQPLFDRLAHSHEHCRYVCPFSADSNFEESPDDPATILGSIGSIRHQCKVVHGLPRNISLQEDIDFTLDCVPWLVSVPPACVVATLKNQEIKGSQQMNRRRLP